MAVFPSANVLILFHLSLLLFTTSISADETLAVYPPAKAPYPPPHHPHHHHHHHHAPAPAPSHPPPPPPSHPSTPPPSHPPSPPPTKPPTPPPVKPPVKPPTPPVKPPVKPPTPPVKPPVKPPTPPPVKPPTPPAVKPPTYPPQRKMVAVQGVVYCKSCKYRGVDTLTGAAPLAGALVKLECNNTKYRLVEQAKTDKNGYFFFMPQKLTTAGSHKCKVFLVSSSLTNCSVPTNLHNGAIGAILVPTPKPPVSAPAPPVKPPTFELFTVGPFAFEPPKKLPCY
ncbi:hypothetical protein CDL12_23071 [Handroanthus impetiginosus]|uniref:Uncharacterized protein n=1 Tax=Handroanthus impetiginosus TaxID=429701 RepID=A0A2G9GGH3_9LAMI|nr:hypothetical protein CDL12_23071 [Handroanthus impetiginosus]